MHIILCGHKASGKTTLAKAYSETFGYDYLDTDTLILDAETTHTSIPSLYRALGEADFRALEARTIQAIQPFTTPTILATGGGSVLDAANVAHLKSLGRLIYVEVAQHIREARIKPASTAIAITNKNARERIYQRVADLTLDASHQPISTLITTLHHMRCHHGESFIWTIVSHHHLG